MFDLKTAIKGAAAGFVISFIAGIIGRVDFLIILLRAVLSAVFSGLLVCGIRFLYMNFLSAGENDSSAVAEPVKNSALGTVVDITLDDEELPDTDTAPAFVVKMQEQDVAEEEDKDTVQSLESTQSDITEADSVSEQADEDDEIPAPPSAPSAPSRNEKAEVFIPMPLGVPVQSNAGNAGSPSGTADDSTMSASQVPSDAEDIEDVQDAEVLDAEEGADSALPDGRQESNVLNASADTALNTLPDLESFIPHYEGGEGKNDNDTSDSPVMPPPVNTSRPMQEGFSVDVSDTENIASAIRTALRSDS